MVINKDFKWRNGFSLKKNKVWCIELCKESCVMARTFAYIFFSFGLKLVISSFTSIYCVPTTGAGGIGGYRDVPVLKSFLHNDQNIQPIERAEFI